MSAIERIKSSIYSVCGIVRTQTTWISVVHPPQLAEWCHSQLFNSQTNYSTFKKYNNKYFLISISKQGNFLKLLVNGVYTRYNDPIRYKSPDWFSIEDSCFTLGITTFKNHNSYNITTPESGPKRFSPFLYSECMVGGTWTESTTSLSP